MNDDATPLGDLTPAELRTFAAGYLEAIRDREAEWGRLVTACTIAYRVEEEDHFLVFDSHGTLLVEYPWPAPGTKYVGNGQPRGPRKGR